MSRMMTTQRETCFVRESPLRIATALKRERWRRKRRMRLLLLLLLQRQ